MENPWKECAEKLEKNYCAKCDEGKIQVIADKIAKNKDKDDKICLELPPQPFEGCVKNSKIVILTLNPGFKEGDEAQQSKKEFIEETTKCMLQKPDAKFFSLMSKFKGDNHYNWWTEHLIVKKDEKIHKELFKDVDKYREFLINNLSVIEFFPYHSKKGGGVKRKYAKLDSQDYSFKLVTEAISAKKTIIIQRSVEEWLKAVPELKTYSYYECKSPSSASISNNNLKKANGEEASLSDILKPFAY